MHTAYNAPRNEAGLLIDAINAFICLNQQLALENINRIGPSLSCVAQNSFTASSDLFLTGAFSQSREGSSQRYPFVWCSHTHIDCLYVELEGNGKWYAEDGSAVGSLESLLKFSRIYTIMASILNT